MSSLIENSYRTARYWVRFRAHGVRVHVDRRNPGLDRLLRQWRAQRWGMVTAWNPRSRLLPRWRNQGRNAVLLRELKRNGFEVLTTRSDGPNWSAELGFLVLDIATDEIRRLGREFRQNAVLAGRRSGRAKLLWCSAPRYKNKRECVSL